MKGPSKRYSLALAATTAVVLALVYVAARSRPGGKDWLMVSTPVVRSLINAGAVTTSVAFSVSNAGPRAVNFAVWWLECKSKRDRTLLATNQLQLVWMPLLPRKSTNLTMHVSLGSLPVEDCLCGCMVWWIEERASWRELRDRAASWALGLLDISRLPWQRENEKLTSGHAFAANIEVADYFFRMHGWTRDTWLGDVARMRAAPARGSTEFYPMRPNAEVTLENEARLAFVTFCEGSTDSSGKAERVASPNAAPPHR